MAVEELLDLTELEASATDVKKKLSRKLDKAAESSDSAVIYLGRIPRGFYEKQMESYFSQFGKVLRLRLSRSRKTGGTRHYAFIEFASAQVAQIVAETMNNYLLMGHILQCHVLEQTAVHPRIWVGANQRRVYPAAAKARQQCNSDKTPVARGQIGRRLKKSDAAKRARIAAQGIDYTFDGHCG